MQKDTTSIDLISCGKTFKDGTRALEKINLNIISINISYINNTIYWRELIGPDRY